MKISQEHVGSKVNEILIWALFTHMLPLQDAGQIAHGKKCLKRTFKCGGR